MISLGIGGVRAERQRCRATLDSCNVHFEEACNVGLVLEAIEASQWKISVIEPRQQIGLGAEY